MAQLYESDESYYARLASQLQSQLINLRQSNKHLMDNQTVALQRLDAKLNENTELKLKMKALQENLSSLQADLNKQAGIICARDKSLREAKDLAESYRKKNVSLAQAKFEFDGKIAEVNDAKSEIVEKYQERNITLSTLVTELKQKLTCAESRAQMCADQRDSCIKNVASTEKLLRETKTELSEAHALACEFEKVRDYLRVEVGLPESAEPSGVLVRLKEWGRRTTRDDGAAGECDKLRGEIVKLKKIIALNMECLTDGQRKRRRPL